MVAVRIGRFGEGFLAGIGSSIQIPCDGFQLRPDGVDLLGATADGTPMHIVSDDVEADLTEAA